jgi:hypothetical protein
VGIESHLLGISNCCQHYHGEGIWRGELFIFYEDRITNKTNGRLNIGSLYSRSSPSPSVLFNLQIISQLIVVDFHLRHCCQLWSKHIPSLSRSPQLVYWRCTVCRQYRWLCIRLRPSVLRMYAHSSHFHNAANQLSDGGTESIAITAGETKNPTKNLPRVVKNVF